MRSVRSHYTSEREKKPIARSRCRLEKNIGMDFEEIDINTWNWVDSAQDKGYWRVFVNAAFNLRFP